MTAAAERFSSPLWREKHPVMWSRIASRTSTMMKASCETPASTATPPISSIIQNEAAKIAQSSVGGRRTTPAINCIISSGEMEARYSISFHASGLCSERRKTARLVPKGRETPGVRSSIDGSGAVIQIF